MHSELHTNPDIYLRSSFPNFDRPKIIGYIGIENIMYARSVDNKTVCFDLNVHMQDAIRKPADLDVKLDDLLTFLVENERRLNLAISSSRNHSKIFCYRGLMTCVACTPYENREPWKIVAILYKGNIYLCAKDTEDKINRKCNVTEQDKKFTSWGYKFEQYMLSDSPVSTPNPDVPVDETKEFSLVFSTTLNKHYIIYGAEMDGIRCDKGSVSAPPSGQDPDTIVNYLTDKEFIELKTSRHIQHSKQDYSFKRFKTKKWWCQSFLVGIDTIVCGFRDDNGIVEELNVFPVRDIAKMSEKFWKPNVCFNFLDTFFIYVKRCLEKEIKKKHGEQALKNIKELPLVSLLLEWNPGRPVQVSENYVYEDDPILTKYFTENFGKML